MSITLNPTPGAADANTYTSLAEYKYYISTRRPQPKWAPLAFAGNTIDDLLTIDLIASCRILSAAFDWTGTVATDIQALLWGRIGMLGANGKPLAADVIPAQLKDAQSELAIQLHDSDLLSDNLAVKFGVGSVKAGSVAVSFQSTSDSREAVDTIIRRLGAKFNYLSDSIPRAVRLLLIPSWYREATLAAPFLLEVL